ncbi:MAG: hypothetical protein WB580_19685, partial [Candidatus Binataceae bacterium]
MEIDLVKNFRSRSRVGPTRLTGRRELADDSDLKGDERINVFYCMGCACNRHPRDSNFPLPQGRSLLCAG